MKEDVGFHDLFINKTYLKEAAKIL